MVINMSPSDILPTLIKKGLLAHIAEVANDSNKSLNDRLREIEIIIAVGKQIAEVKK